MLEAHAILALRQDYSVYQRLTSRRSQHEARKIVCKKERDQISEYENE